MELEITPTDDGSGLWFRLNDETWEKRLLYHESRALEQARERPAGARDLLGGLLDEELFARLQAAPPGTPLILRVGDGTPWDLIGLGHPSLAERFAVALTGPEPRFLAEPHAGTPTAVLLVQHESAGAIPALPFPVAPLAEATHDALTRRLFQEPVSVACLWTGRESLARWQNLVPDFAPSLVLVGSDARDWADCLLELGVRAVLGPRWGQVDLGLASRVLDEMAGGVTLAEALRKGRDGCASLALWGPPGLTLGDLRPLRISPALTRNT
ncbi:MAG: hypothetical protein AB1758_14415, partial [Candidatus Eremiobacterota bacterium]